jgi:hypothetical protein
MLNFTSLMLSVVLLLLLATHANIIRTRLMLHFC